MAQPPTYPDLPDLPDVVRQLQGHWPFENPLKGIVPRSKGHEEIIYAEEAAVLCTDDAQLAGLEIQAEMLRARANQLVAEAAQLEGSTAPGAKEAAEHARQLAQTMLGTSQNVKHQIASLKENPKQRAPIKPSLIGVLSAQLNQGIHSAEEALDTIHAVADSTSAGIKKTATQVAAARAASERWVGAVCNVDPRTVATVTRASDLWVSLNESSGVCVASPSQERVTTDSLAAALSDTGTGCEVVNLSNKPTTKTLANALEPKKDPDKIFNISFADAKYACQQNAVCSAVVLAPARGAKHALSAGIEGLNEFKNASIEKAKAAGDVVGKIANNALTEAKHVVNSAQIAVGKFSEGVNHLATNTVEGIQRAGANALQMGETMLSNTTAHVAASAGKTLNQTMATAKALLGQDKKPAPTLTNLSHIASMADGAMKTALTTAVGHSALLNGSVQFVKDKVAGVAAGIDFSKLPKLPNLLPTKDKKESPTLGD